MFGGILMTLLLLIAVFLILLVLVQRGRGGGLAGALGGMGGQSAFGTKAGDLFTRITIVAAFLWIVLCAVSVKYYNQDETFDRSLGGAAAPADGKGLPRSGTAPGEQSSAPVSAGGGATTGQPAPPAEKGETQSQ